MKKTRMLLLLIFLGSIVLAQGCSAEKARITGFLSDYTKLESDSDTSARYVASEAQLAKYSRFIVNPVEIHLQPGSKMAYKLDPEEQRELTGYMHEAIVKHLRAGGYGVAQGAGPRVATLRVALTDFKKSKAAQNILPQTKLIGSGLGGASMEAELLDSQTHVQLAAVVQSQLGSRLSFDGLSKWGDAKAVIDDWAKQFVKRLDSIHGR